MSKRSERIKALSEGSKASERPECVDDEHLEYLKDLRESGAVNMFGARSYLMDAFPDLSSKDAATVLGWWMKNGPF
jgi:hypothetical protein